LIESGADPNNPPDEYRFLNRNAFHHAALSKCSIEKLQTLLKVLKDIDKQDDSGNTAMHYAARYRDNAKFIAILLKYKPNCNIKNKQGRTPLHNALDISLDINAVELLLTKGKSNTNICDSEGSSPLHLCASQESVDPMMVGMLLRFGADPNRRNIKGQTALHIAATTANAIVLLLLRYNAKVFVRDKNKNLPSNVAKTDEIKNILLWEERRFKDEGLIENNNNVSNSVSKKKKLSICDGKGQIKFPDNTVVSIPSQCLPNSDTFNLTILSTPSIKEKISNTATLTDNSYYNFELDLEINIPGSMITNSSLYNNPHLPAFTCVSLKDGKEWKSQRNLIVKANGQSSINFKLSCSETNLNKSKYQVRPQFEETSSFNENKDVSTQRLNVQNNKNEAKILFADVLLNGLQTEKDSKKNNEVITNSNLPVISKTEEVVLQEQTRKGSISISSISSNSEDEILNEKRKKALTSLVKQMSQDITNKNIL